MVLLNKLLNEEISMMRAIIIEKVCGPLSNALWLWLQLINPFPCVITDY